MERLNFETLFRIVRWDYNRCFKDESLKMGRRREAGDGH